MFLTCVNYALRQARPAAARATRSCCPTSARRSRTRFGELLGVAARRADRRRLHRRLPRALRDRLADRDDRRARHPRGARGARRPPARRSPPPSRRRSPSRCWRRMGLREHFEVVAGPDLDAPRRGQDRDARPRAARSSARRDAVMVGDRSFDIVAAHAHGLPCDRRHLGHRHARGARTTPAPTGSSPTRTSSPRPQPSCSATNVRAVLADFNLYNDLALAAHQRRGRRPRRDVRARRRLPARAPARTRATCRSCTT